MNTFRDLTLRVESLTTPSLDVDGLVAQGERRLRRRRLAVTAAAAMAVVLLALGGVVAHAMLPKASGPIDRPTTPHQTSNPVTRKVVYSDSGPFAQSTGSIHFGDRTVETGDGFVHIDVTDDGFIYTSHGRAWFSDGGAPVQIGTPCGASPNGIFSHFANRSVMSANAGSRAAWFDCTTSARPTLVVFDTSTRAVVARRPIAICRRGCELVDVTADHIYFNRGVYAGFPEPEYRFSVSARQLRASTRQLYAADLASHSRGLIVGETWQTGTATAGIGQSFDAVGSRLLPVRPTDGKLTRAFDTTTGRAIELRLPVGYHSDPNEAFVVFEWLDADTLALAASGSGNGVGDLLTCHLANGQCGLTVKRAEAAGRHAGYRILPYLPLPG